MKKYECLGHTVGRKRSPTYQAWQNMRARCSNSSRPDYQYYGGRGIKVCAKWHNSFAAFLTDMGERPKGMSLDRRDNNKNYAPNNCRWATKDEQMQNTRATRLLTLGAETMGLAAWARKLGLNKSSLQGRLLRGWPMERALSQGKMR